jgi:release factor glutamine methyltransferase
MAENATPSTEPWTLKRLLTWTTGFFERKGVDEPRLAAEILLAKALGCPRIQLYVRFEQIPEDAQLAEFRDLVKQAADHVPISYLVGVKEFYALEFEVAPGVLIPRPETEVLVQQTIATLTADRRQAGCVLDFCTGSGCVAVALAKNLGELTVVASDVAPDALAIATRNCEKHQMHDRVTLVEADRLALPAAVLPAGGFDAIVANPPYVAAAEMATLPANVREHEPAVALTDGADGLSFHRTLATDGAALLATGGAVLIEIADGQAGAVGRIFAEAGGWRADGVWRDTVGGHERVLRFRRAEVPGD